jgi:hypothetical protein
LSLKKIEMDRDIFSGELKGRVLNLGKAGN